MDGTTIRLLFHLKKEREREREREGEREGKIRTSWIRNSDFFILITTMH